MIAYTNNADGSINVLGGAPTKKILHAILPNQTFEVADAEPLQADSKYFLADNEAYRQAKADEERKRAEQEAIPTAEERIEAQVMYTALMTDTLLEVE